MRDRDRLRCVMPDSVVRSLFCFHPMAKRKSMTKKTRFEVFKRDSFTCQYCGRSAPEIVLHLDHIQPVSKDGDENTFNYITSCVDCNLGKSDRLLSDQSVIAKQKAQLDQLQERREQIEMMLEWRGSLKSIDEDSLAAICDAWEQTVVTYRLNDIGKAEAKKLLKRFGLQSVLDGIDTASQYLEMDHRGRYTSESVDLAWNKIGGVCKLASLPEWKRTLYHIRNTARKRANGGHWQPRTSADLLVDFTEAYESGVPLDALMAIANRGLNYHQLTDAIYTAKEQANG